MVDERLRETLRRRAETVEPTPDGWAAITRRIERRQRRSHSLRVTLAAGMSFAMVAMAVAVISVDDPDTADQNVAATGGTAPAFGPTTIAAPLAAPASILGEVPGQDGGPGSGSPSGPTTVPGPRGPAEIAPRSLLWPETVAELAAAQDAVDRGQQPWRNSPDAVAAAYLGALGLPTPEVVDGSWVGPVGGPAGSLRYTAGGVGGWVNVSRLPNGTVFFVQDLRSDRIVHLRIFRRGDRLGVDVMSAAPGRVAVRTKRPGSDWIGSATGSVIAGELLSLEVAGPASVDLIIQVRHDGDDGGVGVSEHLLLSTMSDMTHDALRQDSEVGIGRLGPVNLGDSMDTVAMLAGIPMTYERTEYCATWSPVDRPEGVTFVSTGRGNSVDVIVVAGPGLLTDEGVGVGDTLADVRRAYPGIEERLTDGGGRLVHMPADPGLAGYEMVFGISEGVVGYIWSGHEGLSMSDEICA